MSNRIPRNAIKIECEILSGNAQGLMVFTKDDTGHWSGTDRNGHKWQMNWSLIRNDKVCRIISIEKENMMGFTSTAEVRAYKAGLTAESRIGNQCMAYDPIMNDMMIEPKSKAGQDYVMRIMAAWMKGRGWDHKKEAV